MKNSQWLLGLALIAGMAQAQSYDLGCSNFPSQAKDFVFRLKAGYTAQEDGSAVLERVEGILFEAENLYVIEKYEAKELKNASYKPRPGKWEDHVKFELESLDGKGWDPNSGGTNELFLSLKPTSVKKVRHDDVPNPGTMHHAKFHAGLELYLGDQGTRVEVDCQGIDYVSDREVKKKQ